MFTVYILKSLKDGKYYIGATNDLEERLIEHRLGKTKSLKNRLPVKLIYTEEFETKHEALMREKQIKGYKGGNSFKKLIALTM
jgi:putative endonuclease